MKIHPIALITTLITLIMLAIFTVLPVAADKKPPAAAVLDPGTYSHFANTGMRLYPGGGPVYLSTITWAESSIGYYVPTGNAFVAPAPALTRVSGGCQMQNNVYVPMRATLTVDIRSPILLIDESGADDESVATFVATLTGQSFTIRMDTTAPFGCTLLLEKLN